MPGFTKPVDLSQVWFGGLITGSPWSFAAHFLGIMEMEQLQINAPWLDSAGNKAASMEVSQQNHVKMEKMEAVDAVGGSTWKLLAVQPDGSDMI